MTIDYAGESRQIRKEGSSLTVTLGFALVLIYLVLAAQFKSFRDPLIVLLGSVPLAISGALLFSFLDITTINIYSQVGLITLVGLIAKNGILIVEFANRLQAQGWPSSGHPRGVAHAAPSGAHDFRRHRVRALPARAGDGPGLRGAKQHRPGAGDRDGRGDDVHALRRAGVLSPDGGAAQGGAGDRRGE